MAAETELMAMSAGADLPAVPEVAQQPEEWLPRMEEHPNWTAISRLPVVLTVCVPLSGFKVKDLLQLQKGQLIRSDWSATEDVSVKAGRTQLAWSEFEVVDDAMAVRIARLA